MNLKSSVTLSAGIVTLLGIAGLLGALAAVWTTYSFMNTAKQTDGEIIELVARPSRNGGYTYCPVVRFTPEGSGSITAASGVCSSPASFDRGDHVTVLYSPRNPKRFYMDTFLDMWLLPTIFGGVGLILFLVGILMMNPIIAESRVRHLKGSGIRVTAKVTDKEWGNIRVNGVAPIVLIAEAKHPVTSQTVAVRSGYIWTESINGPMHETVDVYFDPVNPKRYYVDTTLMHTDHAA